MKLSVIIISYNTKRLLDKAIQSCLHCGFSDFEIIVVDNCSSDGSYDLVSQKYKDVIAIKNPINLGFAKANNLAMSLARGKYYLLLNSDAFLLQQDYGALFDFWERNPHIAAIGPKVLNSDLSLQSKGFPFPSVGQDLSILFRLPKFFKKTTLNRLFPQYYWDEDSARPVDWISGCCMFLRRESVEKIGGLSEDFFMYFEEEEWCYRARKAGCQVWYYPAISVIHENYASPMQSRTEVVRRSAKIFLRKTIGIPRGVFIQAIGLLNSVVTLFLACFTFRASRVNSYARQIRDQMTYISYLLSRDT